MGSKEPTHDIAEDVDRQTIRERLNAKTEEFAKEIRPGDVVIDMVEDRPLFVRRKVADTAVDYYADTDFDLTTYKKHRWLPVTPDDAVFECVFLPTHLRDIPASKKKQTYDYPRGRLARVPVEWYWGSESRHQDASNSVRLSHVLAAVDDRDEVTPSDLVDLFREAFDPDLVDEAVVLAERKSDDEGDSDDELGDFEPGK